MVSFVMYCKWYCITYHLTANNVFCSYYYRTHVGNIATLLWLLSRKIWYRWYVVHDWWDCVW